jgi:outer membrane protein assembly factor BamA
VYKSTNYIQTLGDIKLEANIEYRQNLYKFINGALFAEAGNIWLYRDNPDFPGGTFTSDFYKQLAADVGAGLRFDFKILLLRLDVGLPVLKPWVTSSSVPQPASNTFNNMVFNIAIGYPF